MIFQLEGLLWLGGNVATHFKAELGDYTPAGRRKFLSQSLFKISADMSKILMFTDPFHNSSLALIAASLSADLNTIVIFP